MSNAYTLQREAAKNSPSLAANVGEAVSGAYAFIVAAMSSVMRPQAESPAEAATRLRMLADQYSDTQPSYAADLRAAADRASTE